MTTTVTQTQQTDGTWRQTGQNCAAVPNPAVPKAPVITGEMIRQQAERLVPHPAIGTAPADGVTLVRIQTILWLDTPVDRELGTVTLLGQRVSLTAHMQRADWSFGDGANGSTRGPGRAYSRAHPCDTVRCPGYYGHLYHRTGRPQVTATLTWSGTFRINGGPAAPIPGTVTSTATPTRLHVREGRGELVPNP